MKIEIIGDKVILNGVEYTRKDVADLYNVFPEVDFEEMKKAIIEMASRPEGVIQDEYAIASGILEKNRMTSTFRELEKTGVIFKTGEKRKSSRTNGMGNVYFVTKNVKKEI